jgi:hypothetical protein
VTYPDPAAIGSIATAISRAYLPHLTSRQGLRLLTKIRWPRTNRGTVQQREGKAYPMRDDTDVTGGVTRQQASVAEQADPA